MKTVDFKRAARRYGDLIRLMAPEPMEYQDPDRTLPAFTVSCNYNTATATATATASIEWTVSRTAPLTYVAVYGTVTI